MKTFGNIIKEERIKRKLYLRQVAALLDVDQAIISKIERGKRHPSKELVLEFAKNFAIDEKRLLVAWMSDKMVYEIESTGLAKEILQLTEEKINYNKNNM
jgi:transcriptional regulator with XRE-family HTH domain